MTRAGGRLWMATFRDREPRSYDELPLYFRTRRAAEGWAEQENRSNDWDEVLVARAAPDDVRLGDIDWDDDR